jgi:hypothetical protein
MRLYGAWVEWVPDYPGADGWAYEPRNCDAPTLAFRPRCFTSEPSDLDELVEHYKGLSSVKSVEIFGVSISTWVDRSKGTEGCGVDAG